MENDSQLNPDLWIAKLRGTERLTDNDCMGFGKYLGKQLGKIPDGYFLWLLRQAWISKYPALLTYAQIIEKNCDS